MALDVRSAEAGWQLFPQFSELSSRTAASIALIGSQVAECVAPTFSVRNSLISTKHLVSGLACSESAPDPTNSGLAWARQAVLRQAHGLAVAPAKLIDGLEWSEHK